MPFAKALKSFRGRYGLIRAGTQFNCEPGYFAALEKKGWVQEVKGEKPKDPAPEKRREPAPDKNRKKPDAPNRAGKVGAAPGGVTHASIVKAKGSVRAPGAGKALTSRSLRADLPSKKTTSDESENGDSTQAAEEANDDA